MHYIRIFPSELTNLLPTPTPPLPLEVAQHRGWRETAAFHAFQAALKGVAGAQHEVEPIVQATVQAVLKVGSDIFGGEFHSFVWGCFHCNGYFRIDC